MCGGKEIKLIDPDKQYRLLPDNKVIEVNAKTGYKFRFGFTQSLTTGRIAFNADWYFDDPKEFEENVDFLKNRLHDLEESFEPNYDLASDIRKVMTDISKLKEENQEKAS